MPHPNKTESPARQYDELLVRINEAVAAANEAEAKATTARAELVSRSKTVGLLLLEAKKRHPKVADFEAFLKRINGLKLSRAYDFLKLAGGRTTDEELRQEARDRKRKSREKKKDQEKGLPEPKPISVTVTESPEISAAQRRNANLGMTAAERSKQNLEWFSVACREYLPHITVEAHRQVARDLVAKITGDQAKAA